MGKRHIGRRGEEQMDGGAWIVFAVGLVGLVLSIPAFWHTQRATSFLPVPGRVVERSVVPAPWFRVTAGWGPYVLKVKYAYLVNGGELVSDRFSFVPHRYGRKRADAELANLPDQLTVFVNSHNPADAVVDRRGAGAAVFTFLIGGVAMTYAMSSMLYR
jgi:hypothetical protein